PFAWAAIYLLIEREPSERAERLLALWPFILITSLVSAIVVVRRRSGTALVLPFVLIATAQGAFLSQQLWGSTYAIWPLWTILVAGVMVSINSFAKSNPAWATIPLTGVIMLSTLI